MRYCRECEKILHGRSDQKFCNDTCRNTFNKKKVKQEKLPPHPLQKAILKIIERNYDILKRAYPHPIVPARYEYIAVARMDKKFDPDFFTSIYQTPDGERWYVCFDRGWRIVGERYHMKDFLEKAWIRDEDFKLNK